ncbi:MAG TPA: ATP-binding protein [Pirellulales bacterium]
MRPRQPRRANLWLTRWLLRAPRSASARYGVAVVSLLIAVAVRMALDPVLGDQLPFMTFFVALLFTAWYGGLVPSLISLPIGSVLATYLFLEPRGQVWAIDLEHRVGVGLYWFAGSLIALLADSLRVMYERAEDGVRQAREKQRMLEREVADRRRTEESIRFLAQASETLAELIDYESTLQKIARLAVPYFADWCAVDIVEADDSVRRLAVAHVDPAKVRLAAELDRRFPPDPSGPYGFHIVLRSGHSQLVPSVPDEMLQRVAQTPEHLRMLRELGLKSYLCVPMVSRGKILGFLTFVSAESGYGYSRSDLALAESLAHRAAIAIENSRLYRELREADQRKDEFLAMLAHELRNPLAPLRNALGILQMGKIDAETVGWARAVMERQVQHMSRLVDDLLDVSRIMRGKIELHREPIELSSVVERAVETVRPAIDAREHALHIDLPAEPLWIDADLIRIAQVLSNLLNNAAKYTEPGGTIWLTADAEEARVTLRVRDTGMGIAPPMLSRVFELFAQAEQTIDRSQGGLGIGLTLVRQLVELHGGSVEAYSEGVGRGSEFRVRLPRIAAPSTGQDDKPDRAAADLRTVASHRRVLIVDDNADAAHTLAVMLQFGRHEVEIAHDGPAALDKVSAFQPDLVLLDIGLPGMNGYEVAQQMRAKPDLEQTLLVAMTGYGQEEDRRRSLAAGFDRHLVKPVALATLQEVLSEARPAGMSVK